MARGHKDDLPDGESELFLREGLDNDFAKLPDGQISEARRCGPEKVRTPAIALYVC
jgi:hypothetical protein